MRKMFIIFGLALISLSLIYAASKGRNTVKIVPAYERSGIKQSDIAMVGGSIRDFETYHADKLMWGFLTNWTTYRPESHDAFFGAYKTEMTAYQNMGIEYTSRIEWDVVWDGMLARYPEEYTEALTLGFDGEPVEISFFPGHYFFSHHTELFKEYLKWQVDSAFYDGAVPSRILLDSQQSAASFYTRGGDFSAACMTGFRQWLEAGFSIEELNNMGITDVDSFHYRDFLVEQGYTYESYMRKIKRWPNTIPLSEVYRQFMLEYNNALIDEMVLYIQEKAGDESIPVGTSSPVYDPYWNGARLLYTDSIDFYVQEFSHQADSMNLPVWTGYLYKLSEAIGKTLVLTAQPQPDWIHMQQNRSVNLSRHWIAEAYSNGAVFMAPKKQWAYGGNHYRAGKGDYEAYYDMIDRHPELFDDYSGIGSTCLIYTHSEYRNDGGNASCLRMITELQDQNVPFELVIAGDEWWPKYLSDPDQISTLETSERIVITERSWTYLGEEQQQTLERYDEKLRIVKGRPLTDLSHYADRIEFSMKEIRALPRQKEDDGVKMTVIHLLNDNYRSEEDVFEQAIDLTVRIPVDLAGSGIKKIMYYRPGEDAVQLAVAIKEQDYEVNVPYLDVWGILELSEN